MDKSYRWKVEILDDAGNVISTHQFNTMEEMKAKFPFLSNRWTIHNLIKNKYKLKPNKIGKNRCDFYKNLHITKIIA